MLAEARDEQQPHWPEASPQPHRSAEQPRQQDVPELCPTTRSPADEQSPAQQADALRSPEQPEDE